MNNAAKEYAIATGLRGFCDTELRVLVTRRDETAGLVWVRTADLRDSGTPLVLNADQLRPEQSVTTLVAHPAGLLWFEAP